SNVSAPLHISIHNAGRPIPTLPGPLNLAVGHNLTLDLKDFATDDTDQPAQLTWSVVLSAGVGGTPGAAEAREVGAHGLTLRPILPGDVDINLSVRDRAGNLALAVLHLHIVANQPPTFRTLDGAVFPLPQDSEVRIVILDYLEDPDDAF